MATYRVPSWNRPGLSPVSRTVGGLAAGASELVPFNDRTHDEVPIYLANYSTAINSQLSITRAFIEPPPAAPTPFIESLLDMPVWRLDNRSHVYSQQEVTGTLQPLREALPLIGRLSVSDPVFPLSSQTTVSAQRDVTGTLQPIRAALPLIGRLSVSDPVLPLSRHASLSAQLDVTGTLQPLRDALPFFGRASQDAPSLTPDRGVAIRSQEDVISGFIPTAPVVPDPFFQVSDDYFPRLINSLAAVESQPGVTGTLQPLRAALPLLGRVLVDSPVREINRGISVLAQTSVTSNRLPLTSVVPPLPIGGASYNMPVYSLSGGPAIRSQTSVTGINLPLTPVTPPSGVSLVQVIII